MSLTASALRKLAEFGLTLEQVVEVATANEERAYTVSSNAERQARYRARRGANQERNVTNNVTRNVTEEPPASPSLPEVSPHTPLPNPLSPSTPKEKTPKGVQKKAVRLPADWVLPPDFAADARALGLSQADIKLEAAKMLDWSLSSPNGAKLDWRATWRNWCRSALQSRQTRASPSRQPTLSEAFGQMAALLEPEHGNDPGTVGTAVRYLAGPQGHG